VLRVVVHEGECEVVNADERVEAEDQTTAVEKAPAREEEPHMERQEDFADAGHLRRVKGRVNICIYICLCICM